MREGSKMPYTRGTTGFFLYSCYHPGSLYFDKLQKLEFQPFYAPTKKLFISAAQRDQHKWKQCKILSKNMKMVIWPSHSRHMYAPLHVFNTTESVRSLLFDLFAILLQRPPATIPTMLLELGKQCKNGEIFLTIDVAKIKIRLFGCVCVSFFFRFSRSWQFVYDEIK